MPLSVDQNIALCSVLCPVMFVIIVHYKLLCLSLSLLIKTCSVLFVIFVYYNYVSLDTRPDITVMADLA